MSQSENGESVSKTLASSLVQFRRLKSFPTERHPCDTPRRFRHSEIMVMMAIREISEKDPQGASISDLGEYLFIKSPTVTPIVYNLERENMVVRSIDPRDRRVAHIRLSEKGEKIIEMHAQHFLTYVDGLVEYLGTDKSKLLAGLLDDAYQYMVQTQKLKAHKQGDR